MLPRRCGFAVRSLKSSASSKSIWIESGKAARTHVVFPVPREPKRKKFFRAGGLINLEYTLPFCMEIWSCQGNTAWHSTRGA